MVENGFGPTNFWPPTVSRSQLKRRKHYASEILVLSSNSNPNTVVDNNPTLLSNLENNLEDKNIVPLTEVSSNLQPDQIDKIHVQNHKRLVECQNEYLNLFDELKLNQVESISVTTRRFTRSMAMVMTPATIQQQRESPMVEILSDEDNISPIHEIPHYVDDDEHIVDMNNHVSTSPKISTDGVSLCRSKPKPSCIGSSSPTRSGKFFKQFLKHILRNKVSHLEANIN